MPRPSNRDDMGLTATEARLLAVLAARHERWATADELIRDGLRYDRDRSSEASLRTHIYNLRSAGLSMTDLAAVLGGPVTKETYVGLINSYLAGAPGRTLATLVRETQERLAFAGECDLVDGASDRALADRTARLGNEVVVTIRGVVVGRAHKGVSKTAREAHGVCTIRVEDVRFGEVEDVPADGPDLVPSTDGEDPEEEGSVLDQALAEALS